MTPDWRLRIGGLILGVLAALPQVGSGQDTSTLSLSEVLRLDGYTHDLVAVPQAVGAPGGGVVLSQPMDARLRTFSMDGEAAWTAGRAGDGPGEFRTISQIGRKGESIWVVDGRASRISYFDGEGRFVGDERLPMFARLNNSTGGQVATYAFVGPMTAYEDGSYLAVLALRTPPLGSDITEYARVDGEGTVLNPVATTVSAPGFFVGGSGGSFSADLPYQHRTAVAASASGSHLVVATPRVVEDRALVTVEVFRPDGDTVFVRDLTVEAEGIPRHVWQDALRRGSSHLSADLRDEYVRQATESATGLFPYLDGALVTDDGRVWIALRSRETVRPLILLDAQGRTVGMAEVPENTRPVSAFENVLVTVEADEFDVESLVCYELRR